MVKKIQIPQVFEDLFNPAYRYKCYYGGRGGAKSESFGRGSLIITSRQPKRFLCTREKQNSIKDSVHKLLSDLIDGYNLWGYRVLRDAILHKNGSEYLFKGLYNSIGSIKSLQDIDYCWVEEAQYISKESIDILLPTIRAKNSEIWFSFNRLKEKDPVWSELCENPDEKTLIKKVNWSENPFFPDVLNHERLRYLKNKPEEYPHIWEGEPARHLQGLVTRYFINDCSLKPETKKYEFSDNSNVRPVNYRPDKDLHLTCDFNRDPNSWILAHKTENKVFFFDELVLEDSPTQKSIQEFLKRYPAHKSKIIINGDASGTQRKADNEFHNYAIIENALRNYGYKDISLEIKSFNPRIDNRISAWNDKIKNLDGHPEVFIDPKCKWLIYNCENLSYKEGTKEVDTPSINDIAKDKELKFLGHPFDAASYLVDYYWPITLQ